MSVLLADDHGDFLAAVARHLEPHFEVLKTVGNGQALVDEATRLEPDVVVLDISMPVLNGIEAARKLKATGSSARVVFLTVHADPDYVNAAFGTGALGLCPQVRARVGPAALPQGSPGRPIFRFSLHRTVRVLLVTG